MDPQAEKRARDRVARAARKYRERTDPDRVALTLAEKSREMSYRYRAQAKALSRVDQTARGVADEARTPPLTRFWYLTYGRQVYALWRRARPGPAESELALLEQRWQTRGLDPLILGRVRVRVLEELGPRESYQDRVDPDDDAGSI